MLFSMAGGADVDPCSEAICGHVHQLPAALVLVAPPCHWHHVRDLCPSMAGSSRGGHVVPRPVALGHPLGTMPCLPLRSCSHLGRLGLLNPRSSTHSTGITSERCGVPPACCPRPFPGDAQPGVNACQPRWLQPSCAPMHPLLLRFAPATKQLIFVDRGGVLGSLCSSRRQRDTPWSPGISWHFAQMASVCVSRT